MGDMDRIRARIDVMDEAIVCMWIKGGQEDPNDAVKGEDDPGRLRVSPDVVAEECKRAVGVRLPPALAAAIARRVEVGNEVVVCKATAQAPKDETEALLQTTHPVREAEVVDRARGVAARAGATPEAQDEVARLYTELIMPLTRRVQVALLLGRREFMPSPHSVA